MSELTQLKARLAELEIRPNKKLGQNFLISESVIKRIIDSVALAQPSALVEVGPGLGALTDSLLKLGPPVTLIELDRTLAEYWSARYAAQVVRADALQIDWRELELPEQTCLVSNLPYQISSSLVIERSLGPPQISQMVLMFQKEVAQRLQSQPDQKSYGLLSVMAQTFWQMQTVVDAAPAAFYPAPQVASRVLSFVRRSSPVVDKVGYLAFVKAGFALRRKQVKKALIAYAHMKWQRSETETLAAFDEVGVGHLQRAENITVEQWQILFMKLS
jgi:16S rRNA (adenine1518-N6/adenine1519-N6)-dimethyltransferase